MMKKTSIVAAVLLSLAIGIGPALAQQDQPPPAAPPPPSAKSKMSPEQKAISKACSDQANAKNLHGDERKKFRAECKRKGGKME
jgi:psiF repeat